MINKLQLIIIFLIIFLIPKNNFSQWSDNEFPELTGNSYSIDFIDKNKGAACGFYYDRKINGTVSYTTNGGVEWKKSTVPNLSQAFFDIDFTTNSNGYICGEFYEKYPIFSSGCLIKTTNSGETWSTIYNDLTYSKLKFINFLNDSLGYSIGLKYNLKENIIKTTNGGISWVAIYSGDIIFTGINSDLGNLYFTGNDSTKGKILTIKNNIIDSILVDQNLFIRDFSISNNTSFILGYSYPTWNNNSFIYKSTNGGLNWSTIQSFNGYYLNGINYFDNVILLYGQNKYNSLVTFIKDANYNWIEKTFNSPNKNFTLNDSYIFNKNNYILLSGDYATSSISLTYTKHEKEIQKDFSFRSYPNPFNNKTLLELNLLQNSNVTIKIYNILGKEIKTILYQKKLTNGLYKFGVDLSDFNSGIYFSKIIVDNENKIHKLIYLK